MQKSSVGFVYQINDLIFVILRSSQTSYFFIIRKKKCMVEIEKDEEECQWIAYTLSSLSPKRENIKMKKSFLKESFRKDLHWVSHFQSRKKKKSKTKKIPHLNNDVWRKSAKNVVGLGSSACFSVTIRRKSLKNSRNFENSVSLSFSYIRVSDSNRKLNKIHQIKGL